MQPEAAACPQRDSLKARFHADFKVYREAVHQLDLCQPGDFNQVYEDAERARLAFENARAALNSHIAEHGCGKD
jgi:hypothetical protein